MKFRVRFNVVDTNDLIFIAYNLLETSGMSAVDISHAFSDLRAKLKKWAQFNTIEVEFDLDNMTATVIERK